MTEAVLPTHFQNKAGGDSPYSKHAKKAAGYKVNLPTRMLVILGLVFLAVPMIIFGYKEVHIHDEGHPHYKQEKFVNVNTQDVFASFANHSSSSVHGNHTNSTRVIGSTNNTTLTQQAAAAPINRNQTQPTGTEQLEAQEANTAVEASENNGENVVSGADSSTIDTTGEEIATVDDTDEILEG